MPEKLQYDVVVAGGGMSGICAAMAAARGGARTALVQDRPMLGGNASSEIRMHICGADRHGSVDDARESGILEELLLENRYNNPQHSFCVQDAFFWAAVKKQSNLHLYLNTRILGAETSGGRISALSAVQMTSEKQFRFEADFFVDATGDGFVGFCAGAGYMYGREDCRAFGEPHAAAKADRCVMGSSILFTAKDMGHPVPFIKPEWAYTFTEEQLKHRAHTEITSGYWWIELSGLLDPVSDAETIRDELLKVLYGVWDHIKNQPGHHAENYALDWVGFLPGKRESRRLTGDYVLTENDVAASRIFPDTVAYGGWNMDVHVPGGILSEENAPTTYYKFDDVYAIPYRCLYSENIENLFLAGRAISVSHIAFGSTRVMGTCAVVGQAVGTAAALALRRGVRDARGVAPYMAELQQRLLRDGCFLPGIANEDENDLARSASVTASSFRPGAEPDNVINGVGRNRRGKCNAYISEGIRPEGEILSLRWREPVAANCVCLRFDTNFGKELTITLSDAIRRRQRPFPPELVRDFGVMLCLGNKTVYSCEVQGNIQRCRDIRFPRQTFDRLDIRLRATHGAPDASVFEVRVYED